MFEADLLNYLKSDQVISELLGNRIYPGVLPEKCTKPAVAYSEITGMGHHDIDVAFPHFQFSCFSPRLMDAKKVRAAIENALKRFKGTMGKTRVIQGVVAGKHELYEEDTKLHNVIIVMKIIYRE